MAFASLKTVSMQAVIKLVLALVGEKEGFADLGPVLRV